MVAMSVGNLGAALVDAGITEHEHVNDIPHPFWGDPPDIATCDVWMQTVLRSYQRIEEELSFAKNGGRITDEAGRTLTQSEYAGWRREKVTAKHKRMHRYRILKEWRHWAVTNANVPEVKERRSTNGHAIKLAVKRYGKLENLAEAFEAWLADDADETWEALLHAREDLYGMGEALAEAAAP